MRATKKSEMVMNQVAVTTENLQNILDCGRPTAVEIGTLAKARVEMGRRVLWNISKIQKYLDSISTE
ncbi:MAG: hypothetical protein BHW30_06655 [Firmicutes bacterium CAG_194_44_15]|nr:MAG: hypothetical protein BHW30_06655 [Firmicutes bacterium CAG_194_44_15]